MKTGEEVSDQDKVSRPQGRVRRITQVFGQVFSKSFHKCQVFSHLVKKSVQLSIFSIFMNLVDRGLTENQITQSLTRKWSR